MKSFSSILGWLLLAAVLAVPSFLFYNWWSKSRQQASTEITRGPVTTDVFPASAPAAAAPPSAAPQPAGNVPAAAAAVSSQTAAAPAEPAFKAAPASQAPSPAVQPSPGPAAAVPPAAKAVPDARPAASPGPASRPAPAPAPQGSGADSLPVRISTAPQPVSYYDPKSTRDPTLTPDDYRKIREQEYQRLQEERQQRLAEIRRRPPGPETLISLQGIVGTAAIINGDMYRAGQTVRGIKILKVGPDYVLCEYRGKRFRKVMR